MCVCVCVCVCVKESVRMRLLTRVCEREVCHFPRGPGEFNEGEVAHWWVGGGETGSLLRPTLQRSSGTLNREGGGRGPYQPWWWWWWCLCVRGGEINHFPSRFAGSLEPPSRPCRAAQPLSSCNPARLRRAGSPPRTW